MSKMSNETRIQEIKKIKKDLDMKILMIRSVQYKLDGEIIALSAEHLIENIPLENEDCRNEPIRE